MIDPFQGQGHDENHVARGGHRGAVIGSYVALFALTVWYCASAPYNLYTYDEGYFLYEAKRIVDGDVFYRDFFDIVTPLGWYAMAGSYWLFGVTMATARTTMAVVHGAIAVGAMVACRLMGVRLAFAIAVGLSEPAVSYMANERAAPHWFGTLFCVLILVQLLRRPLTTRRDLFAVGLLVGGLALTQQQRGVAMVWVPIAVLLADRWRVRATAPSSPPSVSLVSGVVAYGVGVTVVVAPVLLFFIAKAGFHDVYLALVRYPLVNYRAVHRVPWGTYNPLEAPYIGPVVKYLSMMVPIATVAYVIARWFADRRLPAREIIVAWFTSIGALLGMTYVPLYGYLVLVGPVWFVLFAYLVEIALRVQERRRPSLRMSAVVTAAFIILFAIRLGYRRAELTAQWPYEHETPFGTVNFASKADIVVNDFIKDLVGVGGDLLIYPTSPGTYLLTGTENITRFHTHFLYMDDEHEQEVLNVLEARRQPYVLRNWVWMNNDVDPILPYLKQHYETVKIPFPRGELPMMWLFRRKPDVPAASSP